MGKRCICSGNALNALNATYKKEIQPEPYSSINYWLRGPKLDITFSRILYFATPD